MNTTQESAQQHVGFTAVEGGEGFIAGAIVWWRLSGGLDIDKLTEAWANEGLDSELLPASPSPLAALRRAVSELRGTERLIRPLKGEAGFAVLDEKQAAGDFEYTKRLAVRVTGIGALRWDHVADQSDADAVAAAYNENLTTLTQGDVSPWLSSMMEEVRAVALRDTGGIYFVPAFSMPEWERMVRAIRASCTHIVSCVPAVRSEEAKTAFLDALAQEAAQTIATMQKVLDSDELGKRALESRVLRAEDVEAKLTTYEELLGGKLGTLHDRIGKLRAELAVAALKDNPQLGLSL